MEAKPFIDARGALRRYERSLVLARNPRSKDLYQQQIENLRTRLKNYIAKREIEDVIPTRSNETQKTAFNKSKYKLRNIVERAIGWLKEYRRVATRYEKNVENYLAMIHIAFTRMIINWY